MVFGRPMCGGAGLAVRGPGGRTHSNRVSGFLPRPARRSVPGAVVAVMPRNQQLRNESRHGVYTFGDGAFDIRGPNARKHPRSSMASRFTGETCPMMPRGRPGGKHRITCGLPGKSRWRCPPCITGPRSGLGLSRCQGCAGSVPVAWDPDSTWSILAARSTSSSVTPPALGVPSRSSTWSPSTVTLQS